MLKPAPHLLRRYVETHFSASVGDLSPSPLVPPQIRRHPYSIPQQGKREAPPVHAAIPTFLPKRPHHRNYL